VHARDSRRVQALDYSAPASRLGFSDELTFLSFYRFMKPKIKSLHGFGRIDTLRVKILKSGQIDSKHQTESLELAAHALDGVLGQRPVLSLGNVVDASAGQRR